jgi:hypothetical protein
MANPTGSTFHYSEEKLNRPGYPGIVRDDGSRAEPAPDRASDFMESVTDRLRDHPLPMFFGAMAIGFFASCLLPRT